VPKKQLSAALLVSEGKTLAPPVTKQPVLREGWSTGEQLEENRTAPHHS